MNKERIDLLTKELRANSEKLYNYTQYFADDLTNYEKNRDNAIARMTTYCLLSRLKDFEELVSVQTGRIINLEEFDKRRKTYAANEDVSKFTNEVSSIIAGLQEWRPFGIMKFVVGDHLTDFLESALYSIISKNVDNNEILPSHFYDTKQKIKTNYNPLKIFQRAAEQLRNTILGLDISSFPTNTNELLNLKLFEYDYFSTKFGTPLEQFVEIQKALKENDFLEEEFFPTLIAYFTNLKDFMEENAALKKQWFLVMTSYWTLKVRSDFHNMQILDSLFNMNPNTSTQEILSKIYQQPLIKEPEFLEQAFWDNIFDFEKDSKNQTKNKDEGGLLQESTSTIFED